MMKLYFSAALLLLQPVCLVSLRANAADVHDGSLADTNIRYVGRWDRHDPAVAHSYWSNAYLRTGFNGTTVKIKLAAPGNVVVAIDGEPARTLSGNGLVDLTPKALRAGEHTLLVASDSQNGEIAFGGLVLDAGAATRPVPARPFIEFVGDSITACQGKGGMATDNYAWLTGEALGCDHTQIAFSGKGLRSGWGALEDKTGFDSLYFRLMNCNHRETAQWDFSGYTPRLVVINQGTNEVRNGRRETDAEFAVTYASFVRAVRAKLPAAEIVALRPFSGFLADGIRQAVAGLNADGDTHVRYLDTAGWLNVDPKTGKVDNVDSSDGLHPSVAGHAKAARRLAEALKPLLSLPPTDVPSPREVGEPEKPAALFGEIIDACRRNTASHALPGIVRVKPGTYTIPDSAPVWDFSGANALKNCTLDLTGVTLIFQGPSKVFARFGGCADAAFRGAAMVHEVPPSTQGSVVKLEQAQENWAIVLRVDAGYLDQAADLPIKSPVHIFDGRAGGGSEGGRPAWKDGIGYFLPIAIQAAGDEPHLLRMLFKGSAVPANLAVGDRIDLRGKAGFSFEVKDCAGMIFQDVTLGSSGLYGIVEFGGRNNRYERCRVTYGPRPPGATEDPIAATEADGFHSLGSSQGPTLLDCTIEGTPDDAIAIHGRYAEVIETPAENVVVLRGKSSPVPFAKDDEMRIQDERTGFYLQARVTMAEKVPGTDPRQENWKCTLDRAPGVKAGFLASNPALCGPGYTIINNVIRRNRARGMLLKGDDGVINGNLLEDCTIAGIVLSPEGSGNEAGYVHTATISNNTIRHTGYAENGPGYPYAAALTVTGDGGIGDRDINIIGNSFERILGPNLMVRYTDSARIEGNRFHHTHEVESKNGAKLGIDPQAVIWIGNSRNVALATNIVDNMGPYGKSLLTVDEKTVEAVTGVKDGVVLKAP